MSNKPSFLKKNATIGLCAPSFGCATSPYIERYNNASKTFKKLGYKIVEGENVNSYDFIASATPQKRAQEFMNLMLNNDIDFIFSVGGGELMCQILPYIDFDKIKALKKKKLFMGYSDNTILTFTLPIFADSYAIYGECFPTFGVRKWDKSLKDAYALITGQEMIQHPYPKCADPQKHTDNPLKRDPYIKKTAWKRYQSDEPVTFKGILMGGCMDILNVICGTPYFEIDDYLEKHNIYFLHDIGYFKDLISNQKCVLRPDFILPKEKIWIEYDGEQHFKPIEHFGGLDAFIDLKIKDTMKNKYAEKHNWKLIRIPYWEFDNIEKILTKELIKL